MGNEGTVGARRQFAEWAGVGPLVTASHERARAVIQVVESATAAKRIAAGRLWLTAPRVRTRATPAARNSLILGVR